MWIYRAYFILRKFLCLNLIWRISLIRIRWFFFNLTILLFILDKETIVLHLNVFGLLGLLLLSSLLLKDVFSGYSCIYPSFLINFYFFWVTCILFWLIPISWSRVHFYVLHTKGRIEKLIIYSILLLFRSVILCTKIFFFYLLSYFSLFLSLVYNILGIFCSTSPNLDWYFNCLAILFWRILFLNILDNKWIF